MAFIDIDSHNYFRCDSIRLIMLRPEDLLTIEEFQKMLECARDGRERAILLLLGGAGLRVGELSQIKLKDMDLKNGWLRLRQETTKFGKPRDAVLPQPVIDAIISYMKGESMSYWGNILGSSGNRSPNKCPECKSEQVRFKENTGLKRGKRYECRDCGHRYSLLERPLYSLPDQKNPDNYLFPGRNSCHIHKSSIEKNVIAVAERAGVQSVVACDKLGRKIFRVHPHLLRHSFAVWSLEDNVPIFDLRDQLGHSNIATTSIYLTVKPEHRRQAYLRSGFANRFSAERSV